MTILIDHADAVRTITLHRPEALNALTPALLEELATALDDAAAALVVWRSLLVRPLECVPAPGTVGRSCCATAN